MTTQGRVSPPLSVGALLHQRDLEQSLFGSSKPVRIGRFTVLELVGEGGMGSVFAAYDGTLDRRVALKVLHTKGARDPEAAARMQQEAVALARLSHPSIVTVHEVGSHEGRTFIAMDFAEGGTIDRWAATLNPQGRATAITQRMRECIDGLQAAHDAGLVHRDFKPSNVLVTGQGTATIADFGLARVEQTQDPDRPQDPSADALLETADRAVIGTPAYMAPEQFDGHADRLSDQFGLCATFFELFYGRRPFAGKSLTELCEQVHRGAVDIPEPTPEPRWVLPILMRGLHPDSDRRFRDLRALGRALDRASPQRRPRSAWLAGAAAVALVGAALVWPATDGQAALRRCRVDATEADVLDDLGRPTRDRPVGRADPARGVDARVSEWSQRWRDAVVASCTATHTLSSQSKAQHNRRLQCFRAQLAEVADIVHDLGRSRAEAAYVASRRTLRLPDLEQCGDAGTLDSAASRSIHRHVRLAAMLEDRREIDQAYAVLERATAAAGEDPSAAPLHIERARLLTNDNRLDEAVIATDAALTSAERLRNEELVWLAWRRRARALVLAEGGERARFSLERMRSIGMTLPPSRARDASQRILEALLAQRHGEAGLLDALEAARDSTGIDPELIELALDGVHVASQYTNEARRLARKAVQLARDAYGPESPYAIEVRLDPAVDLALGPYSASHTTPALDESLASSSLSRNVLRSEAERRLARGQRSDALVVLEALTTSTNTRLGIGPRATTELLWLARELFEANEVRAALESYEIVVPRIRAFAEPGSWFHVSTLEAAARAFVASGDHRSARRLFDELLASPRGPLEDPELRGFVVAWLEHDGA